jgi:hypothetical protein
MPDNPSIDERLEALVHTAELAQAEMETLSKKVDALVTVSNRHEEELIRFRRAMRAALEAWLDGDGGAQ